MIGRKLLDDARQPDIAEMPFTGFNLRGQRSGGERFADEAAEALSDLPESRATVALRDAIAYVMERTQ